MTKEIILIFYKKKKSCSTIWKTRGFSLSFIFILHTDFSSLVTIKLIHNPEIGKICDGLRFASPLTNPVVIVTIHVYPSNSICKCHLGFVVIIMEYCSWKEKKQSCYLTKFVFKINDVEFSVGFITFMILFKLRKL